MIHKYIYVLCTTSPGLYDASTSKNRYARVVEIAVENNINI